MPCSLVAVVVAVLALWEQILSFVPWLHLDHTEVRQAHHLACADGLASN
jgi:hypothetical protein